RVPNPPEYPEVFKNVFRMINDVNAIAKKVRVKWRAQAPREAAFYHHTAAAQAATVYKSPRMAGIDDAAFEALFGKDAAQISMLFTAFYCASAGDAKTAGSFARLIATQGGAQQSRITGGSQEIALRVAAALGNRIVLGSPVR